MRCSGARAAVLVPAMLGAALVHGCGADTFACQDDAQCDNGGIAGTCEPNGGCSFPDDSCGSGRRYGAHAPDGLSGHCVDAMPSTVETGDASESVGESASVTVTLTSLDESESSAGNESADATTMAVSASETSSGSLSATQSTGDETSVGTSETTGGPVDEFFDPFDRADAADLGNGWIEKTPGAFRILDEQVELETVNGQDFRNNLFYRPLDESLLDVEASMVVNFVADDPFGFPQLHLRVQSDDVDTPGSLTSYAVFVDTDDPSAPQLTVNRIAGAGFGPAESVPIEPPPVDAETYRLRGRVTGTDPVMVEGFFEVAIDGSWEVRAEGLLVDVDDARISEAGTVGGGGHVALQHFVLDDFAYAPIAE
jgi:hypothetical protein